MRFPFLAAALGLCLVMIAGVALAQDSTPQWYERIAGIIAIPVAIIGIPLTIVTIRKTNLEARKTRLEIQEKERKLAAGNELTEEEEARVLGPLLRENILGSVVFRFVVLFVILQMWGVVAAVWSISLTGARLGLETSGMLWDLFENPTSFDFFFFLAASLPQVVRWIIIFALGWPLLKDVNRYLRLTKPADG